MASTPMKQMTPADRAAHTMEERDANKDVEDGDEAFRGDRKVVMIGVAVDEGVGSIAWRLKLTATWSGSPRKSDTAPCTLSTERGGSK